VEKSKAIIMNQADNVATAVEDLPAGHNVAFVCNGDWKYVLLQHTIPFGHKFAITAIAKTDKVIKYGEPIGAASSNIEPGEHVHIHNMVGLRGRGDLQL